MCSAALEAGVPDWFTDCSPEQTRLVRVLSNPAVEPAFHDSIQVQWDKAKLKAAVFYDEADAALLMDILQE